MRRRAVMAVLAVVLAGCTAGGGGTEAPAPQAVKPTGNVTFWHFFVDREANVIQSVVKDFEAKNPGIKVEVKVGQDDEKMRQAIAAGQGPDVGLSYSTDIVGNFCETGAWRDLKSYVDRDRVDLGALVPVVRQYTEYKGKRCSMPMLADAYGLYYNKKMLAEAGFNAPPKTLSELETMTAKLTKKKKDGTIERAGFVPLFSYYENTLGHWAPAYGSTWLKEDGTSNLGSDPTWKELLTWQRKFTEQYGYDKLNKFSAGKGEEFSAANDFHTGRVAMNIDGEYRIAFLKDQSPDVDFGTAPIPVPDDKADRYGGGYITGNIMGISKGAKNPEAAWALIKYLTLDTDALVKLANGLKNVPTTQAAITSPNLEVDDNFKVFIDMLQHPSSMTSPSTRNGAAYQNTVSEWAENWSAGKVPEGNIDAELAKLDENINNQLKLGEAP